MQVASSSPFFASESGRDAAAAGQLAQAQRQQACLAAWNNNLKVLQSLVDQVKQQGTSMVGYGPLHFAASLGYVEIINFLLDNSMDDKNARDKDGNSPLMWIVAAENHADDEEELMESLVDHGADVNIQNFVGETALYLAAQRGYEAKVDYLLENGANVHVKTLEGATALHAAAANGNENIVYTLARYGSYLNARDEEGDTPLHWAAREGNRDAVKMLVQCGADINAANVDGETPLMLAACCGDQAMIRCLSSLGAAPAGSVPVAPIRFGTGSSAECAMDVEVTEELGKLSFGGAAEKERRLGAGHSDAPNATGVLYY